MQEKCDRVNPEKIEALLHKVLIPGILPDVCSLSGASIGYRLKIFFLLRLKELVRL
jgi:hypothetical protein